MAAFSEAVAVPPEQRDGVLRRTLGDDVSLLREVEAMLRHDNGGTSRAAGGGADDPLALRTGAGLGVAMGEPSDLESVSLHDGSTDLPLLAGHYRIVRVIGEGGMGVVYEAEQTMPRRIVALKAIRSGLIGRQVLARFSREAHILGRLAHPGIAQIHEAGVVQDAGGAYVEQAYLVMEYVDGPTLTDYAKQNNLGIRDRMELAARVCDAVQHAHQRRVIHRDLKPANILVDSTGQPKVLDFGVASLEAERTPLTPFAANSPDAPAVPGLETLGAHIVGTLAYMAPEQLAPATGESAPDTRSDIYSLGVILYELLSEKLPLPVTGIGLAEASRIIADTRPASLGSRDRRLRGDIEIIVAKALEKNRQDRYQAAAELAQDLRRCIASEPIAARGTSLGYVLRMAAKRHRVATALAGACLVALFALGLFAGITSVRNARLAKALAVQLSDSRIERARLMAHTDQASAAEEALWSELSDRPDSRLARWALWDLYSRSPSLTTLPYMGASGFDAAYSPDGSTLAIANQPGGMVSLWTADLATRRWAMEVGSKRVLAVAFSPDGKRIATGDTDGHLKLWNGADGSAITSTDAFKDAVLRLAYSPDGSIIAAVGRGETIALFVAADAKPIRVLEGHKAIVGGMAFVPNSHTLVTASNDQSIRFWDTTTGECTKIIQPPESHRGGVNVVAFSPDGSRMYTGGLERTLKIWDAKSFQILATQSDFAGWPYSISISPDGKLLYLGADGVDVRDAIDGHLLRTITRPDGTRRAIALSPSGDRLTTSSMRGRVSVLETQPQAARHELDVPSLFYCRMSATPDGKLLAAPGGDGSIRLLNPSNWSEFTEMRDASSHAALARAIAFTPDGSLLISGSQDGELRVWSMKDRAPLAKTMDSTGKAIVELAVSPDGRMALSGNSAGRARLWRLPTLEPSGELDLSFVTNSNRSFLSAAWSPDGKRISVGTVSDKLGIWRIGAPSAAPLAPEVLVPIQDPQTALAFSPDGRSLLIGGERSIAIVDARTGHVERMLSGAAQAMVGLVFCGKDTLISASRDRTLRLWDWPSALPLITLDAGPRQPGTLAAAPDGRWAATMGERGGIVTWDLSYYRRHIAGNAPYCLGRLEPRMDPQVEERLIKDLAAEAAKP
jgi:WD40 repeat protein/serine/threonine protein kinase